MQCANTMLNHAIVGITPNLDWQIHKEGFLEEVTVETKEVSRNYRKKVRTARENAPKTE